MHPFIRSINVFLGSTVDASLSPSESTSASTDTSSCLPVTAEAFTDSPIVLTFVESVSILILDSLNYFPGTTVA